MVHSEDFLMSENLTAFSLTVTEHQHWRLLPKMLNKHHYTENVSNNYARVLKYVYEECMLSPCVSWYYINITINHAARTSV